MTVDQREEEESCSLDVFLWAGCREWGGDFKEKRLELLPYRAPRSLHCAISYRNILHIFRAKLPGGQLRGRRLNWIVDYCCSGRLC